MACAAMGTQSSALTELAQKLLEDQRKLFAFERQNSSALWVRKPTTDSD